MYANYFLFSHTFFRSPKGLVVIKKFANNNWDNFRSLEKEFKILRQLNHPQIPKYIGWFELQNNYFLIQEYFAAKNLDNRAFSEVEVWEIAKQILMILKYLNSQKIIHKDIKPANILWDGKTAYLVDFGFSSSLSATPGLSSTLLGTLGFMPPEQLYRGTISHQGDLYSLGVTLFCLLKNIPAADISDYLDKSFDLSIDVLDLPYKLFCWLKQLTNRDIYGRYSSASLALLELNRVLAVKEYRNVPDFSTESIEQVQEVLMKESSKTVSFDADYPQPVLNKTRDKIRSRLFKGISFSNIIAEDFVAIAISGIFLLIAFEGMVEFSIVLVDTLNSLDLGAENISAINTVTGIVFWLFRIVSVGSVVKAFYDSAITDSEFPATFYLTASFILMFASLFIVTTAKIILNV